MRTMNEHLRALRGSRSQRELAEATNLDQTKISRIEAGTTSPTEDDLERWLGQSDPDQARRFRLFWKTTWRAELHPEFDHPDIGILALATETLDKLDAAARDARGPMRGQMDLYRREVERLAHSLLALNHDVVFLGPKGVGKTTAECYATGLRLPPPSGRSTTHKDVALETNTGGTTLGLVYIEKGETWCINIVPEPPDSVRYFVEELCTPDSADSESTESQPILSLEVGRAIRRMAGLDTPRRKLGEAQSPDPIAALVAEHGREAALDLIMARVDLPSRVRTVFLPAPGESPLQWLQRTFRDINAGADRTAPLPQKVRVLVPVAELGDVSVFDSDYDLRLVDTRGVDASQVLRPDIDESLRDHRTVCVLCSPFTVVDSYIRSLVNGLEEKGMLKATLPGLALLMLSQKGAASETKFDGEEVGSQEEGYDVKRDDISIPLKQMGLEAITVGFFDASADSPERLVRFIWDVVDKRRETWRNHVQRLSDATIRLLTDPSAKVRADISEVARRLRPSISLSLPAPQMKISSKMAKAIRHSHWRTVRAMVVRSGAWHWLDLETHVRQAAAVDARRRWDAGMTSLGAVIENFLADEDISGARSMLDDLDEARQATRVEFIHRAETIATTLFVYSMRADDQLWITAKAASGRGYREEIRTQFETWLDQPVRNSRYEAQLKAAWEAEVVVPILNLISNNAEEGHGESPPDL